MRVPFGRACRGPGPPRPGGYVRVRRSGGRLRQDERGSVAAEFAVTLPAVLLVIAIGAGAVVAGAQAARLQGAAADAARLAGRGDSSALGALVATLPGRTSIDVDEGERLVCVTLSSPVVITVLAATRFDVSARACAAAGGR